MRRSRLFRGIPILALALAACGDSSDTDGGSPTTTAAPSGPATSTSTATAAATVAVGDSSLGKILVDARGMTLYLFTKDSNGKSTCEASCASLWPPLATTGAAPIAGSGIDAAKLTTITRTDGSTQVAIGGRPLYLYARDTKPGDVTGQNVGGVWFAVRPDGTAVSGAAS